MRHRAEPSSSLLVTKMAVGGEMSGQREYFVTLKLCREGYRIFAGYHERGRGVDHYTSIPCNVVLSAEDFEEYINDLRELGFDVKIYRKKTNPLGEWLLYIHLRSPDGMHYRIKAVRTTDLWGTTEVSFLDYVAYLDK